jgi:enterochelin esterase family protein
MKQAPGRGPNVVWSGVFAVALAAACSSNEAPPAKTGTAGTTGAAGSGAAGTGVTGTSGAAGSTSAAGAAGATGAAGASSTGAAGAPGAAGSGGASNVAGAGGGAGTAGAAAGAGGGVTGALTGTQDPPGTDGDGTFPLPGPYADTTESTMRMAGAPMGKLTGPISYAITGTYTGWTPGWKLQYWVYVPAQYTPGHRVAISIFQDGLRYVGDPQVDPSQFNLPIVFDNLIFKGDIPVQIAVLIDPGSTSGLWPGGSDPGRGKQYDPPNDQFGKFLLNEFLPSEIVSKYDLVQDPDGWSIGGHSSGGMAAISAAWFYPDKFHKVITASPSFPNTGGKFPALFLSTTPIKPMRIYHLAGTNDLAGGWYDTNNQAAKDLMQMGYHYRYRPGTGMHYPPAEAAQDFPDALRWLWRGYHDPS